MAATATPKKRRRRRSRRRGTTLVAVPAKVARAAEKGLELVAEGYAGKGLTEGALRRAKQLADRKPIPLYAPKGKRSLSMMRAWFARHAVDQRPGWDREKTPGYTAWMVWAGDPARAWAERACAAAERAER